MSYSFKSKDEPATDIFFLNEDNKICHASVIMEGAGGSKNAGFIRMLYASKKNIDIDKMKNPSEHLKSKFKKEEPVKEPEEEEDDQNFESIFKQKNYESINFKTVSILRNAIERYFNSLGRHLTNITNASLNKLYDVIEKRDIDINKLSKIYAGLSLNLKEQYKKNIEEDKNNVDLFKNDAKMKKHVLLGIKRFESRIKSINDEIPSAYIEEYNKKFKIIEGGLLFNGLLQTKNAIGSMPPNVKTLLDKYGDAKISNIKLNKTPVQGAVQFLLNKFSKGGNNFQNELSKLPYDSIYHLQMIFTTDKGRVVLEKNERVNMAERPKETEILNIPFNSNLTIRQIYENGLKVAGEKLFYS